jgi:hypothetical protein
MTYKFPSDTKNYLVLMIENKIETNPQDSVFKDKKLYEEWYDPISWLSTGEKRTKEEAKKEMSGFGGGEGSGQPRLKNKEDSPNFGEILVGDSDEQKQKEEDQDETSPFLKLLGAAGAMGAGAAAGALGKKGAGLLKGAAGALDKTGILGKVGGSALKYASRGVASLGKQAEELSGKTWVEAQLGKIGQSQMELAAQGAGSPWTKFVIPEKKPSKIISPQERQQADYDAETERLAKQMKANEVRKKAKQQGLIP